MALSEVQLDFILEMYVKDDPKRGKFYRGNIGEAAPAAKKATWEKFLIGPANVKYMARYTMSPKARERAKMINQAARVLRATARPKPRGKR